MSIDFHVTVPIEAITRGAVERIRMQLPPRAYRAANELRNAANEKVLRGQRGGRRYNMPGSGRVKYYKRKKIATITYRKYSASAPGEPPAARTGAFRTSWKAAASSSGNVFISKIESDLRTDDEKYLIGELLENGTSRMAPRPHHERIIEKAMPKIMRIYAEPYNL